MIYVPDPQRKSVFVITAYAPGPKAKFSAGWDDAHVQRLLDPTKLEAMRKRSPTMTGRPKRPSTRRRRSAVDLVPTIHDSSRTAGGLPNSARADRLRRLLIAGTLGVGMRGGWGTLHKRVKPSLRQATKGDFEGEPGDPAPSVISGEQHGI